MATWLTVFGRMRGRDLQRKLFAARRPVNMFAANVNQAAAAFHSTDNLPGWIGDAMDLCRCALGRLDEITGRVDRRLGLTVGQ